MNRRDFLKTLTTAGVAAGVAASTTRMMEPEMPGTSRVNDVAERILASRRLRCGYVVGAPYFMKDPNTGKKSGLFYDLTQRLGEIADLEIMWETETTYATLTEDVRLGKFDVYGAGLWPNAQRAQAVTFSLPAFYSGVGIYVRNDDRRFDDASSQLNRPRYRIATIDGEMSQAIQQSDFPNASVLSLPGTTDISMLAESVMTGKADATFLQKAVAADYMRHKPKTLRALPLAQPLRLFENAWALGYGSERLKNMLDVAVKEMTTSGFVDHVLDRYEQSDSYYRVRSPIT
jgi:ABC-type amino acid transport substrate-binding protein